MSTNKCVICRCREAIHLDGCDLCAEHYKMAQSASWKEYKHLPPYMETPCCVCEEEPCAWKVLDTTEDPTQVWLICGGCFELYLAPHSPNYIDPLTNPNMIQVSQRLFLYSNHL